MNEFDSSHTPEALRDFPVVLHQHVGWGDMDAYGHVNNTKYFRYFEDTRIAYLERLKLKMSAADPGMGVVVASTSCKFKRPLKYPDQIWIGARTVNIDETRFSMHYAVYSQSYGAIAATGDALLVYFDLVEQRPKALSPAVIIAIESLEGRSLMA